MSSAFVFDGLRMHLKARGMTYADVARALKISEATVKRIFATRNCSLERLDSICDLVQVDLAELARSSRCAWTRSSAPTIWTRRSASSCCSRLERIGILELHENNRIRLRLARTFAWNADGPIMRYARSQAPDFFDHAFEGPGELMRMVTVRVSGEARMELLRRLEQVAREYDEQHRADSRLPLEQRYPLSVLLAVRYWEPALFKALRRPATRK